VLEFGTNLPMTIVVEAIYENGVLKPARPVDLPDKAEVQLTIETRDDSPKTALGQKLRALRAEILAAGSPVLDWEGIEAEVASHRGGWREGR
jgi:predicted DNA-binding antitoxin AbrB/MazE fold protein